MSNVELKTPCGEIRGLSLDECNLFKGIEYAKAKRFEYPVEVTQWDGVYDATEYGACSYQRRAFEEDEVCNAFYHKEFRKGLSFKYSEDCLFLNIWAPKRAENCPVLIYIHGGSFTGGSTDEGHIDGTEYAKQGIIFVAMNYRLGPFGFCSHPALTDSEGRCGNFGLYDQLCAIDWIKHNIASFGGNPDKITLLGQSAGAMSVDILISSPACKDYFSGAVMMSGAGLQRGFTKPVSPQKTEKFWNKIIENAGVSSVDGLRTLDPKTLYYAWFKACKEDKMSMIYTLPVRDGKIINDSCFNMNTIPDLPIIIGVTATDMVPIMLEHLTKKYGRKASKYRKCYVYNFMRLLPGDSAGAWHSCDLLYAFNTLDFNWRPFEDTDRRISYQLSRAIGAFVKTSDPNCDEIPSWTPDYRKPMHFCENTAIRPWDTKQLFKNTFGNKGAEF